MFAIPMLQMHKNMTAMAKAHSISAENDVSAESTGRNQTMEHKKDPSTIWNWLLLLFIAATLSWVALWTVLSAHTEVARKVIYPFFSSEYFPDKTGARVFTYLGVFYLLAGAVSLLALYMGVRLPKFNWHLLRSFHMLGDYWTLGDMLPIIAFLATQMATVITRATGRFYEDWDPEWSAAKLSYEVTKTLGKTAAITILFLFIPITKSSFWLALFNTKFERAIKFHRLLAWFLVIVVVAHATTAVTSLILSGQFGNCMWPSADCENPGNDWGTYESWQTSRIITYGWLALVFALPLVVFSLPWFRRNKFEWFYYSHFLFIPFMILLHLHYPYMIYYAAAGLAGYIQDKLLWFLASRRPIRILSLTTPVRGYVCLEVAVDPSYSFEPGQWVQINIPAISLLQWHPMSVTSVPGHSSISMDIKVLGDWTRRLEELALQFDASNYSHTTVFMDFFHGSSHLKDWGYLTHPAVIMVAGGIGITPMISAMRTIVSNGIPGIQRVYLVWVVKNESVVDLYREELAHYQAMGNTKFGCKIEVTVHVTLSESESMEASVENKSVKISSGFNPEHLVFFPFRSRNQYWFRQHVYGYGHLLLLVIGSGGGYLVGIFLANFASLNKDLSRESVALLQLSLGSLFAALLVFIGMSGSFSKSTVWTPQKRKCCESTTTIETGLKSKAFLFNNEEAKYELRCVIGCRPDLSAIATDVKSWCRGNGASSIGVSVCGPDSLVDSVAKLCRNNSSCGTPYFLDMETFEW